MSATTQWNAAEYAANSAVQHAWARELIATLKLSGDERVLDVGCGDGKITAELARAVTRGSAIGIDASAEMIRFAREKFPQTQFKNLTFEIRDARWFHHAGEFDLVFSNAALHWVDDHEAFLRCAATALKPGGRLLVSCGGRGNAQEVFLALRPTLRLVRWRKFFRKLPKPYFFFTPEDYKRWLPQFGLKPVRIELVAKDTTYAGAAGFTTWLRTTWLPYTLRVPENLRDEFINDVTQRFIAKHPADAAGNIHVSMVRLEIEAVKI